MLYYISTVQGISAWRGRRQPWRSGGRAPLPPSPILKGNCLLWKCRQAEYFECICSSSFINTKVFYGKTPHVTCPAVYCIYLSDIGLFFSKSLFLFILQVKDSEAGRARKPSIQVVIPNQMCLNQGILKPKTFCYWCYDICYYMLL